MTPKSMTRPTSSSWVASHVNVTRPLWPWSRSHKNHQIDFAEFPNVGRWFETIAARPAVQRGVQVLAAERERQGTTHSKEAWDKLFGAEQYKRR